MATHVVGIIDRVPCAGARQEGFARAGATPQPLLSTLAGVRIHPRGLFEQVRGAGRRAIENRPPRALVAIEEGTSSPRISKPSNPGLAGGIRISVPSDVGLNLLAPPGRVRLRPSRVPGAPMPKAAVDEDQNPAIELNVSQCAHEDDLYPRAAPQDRAMGSPRGQSGSDRGHRSRSSRGGSSAV